MKILNTLLSFALVSSVIFVHAIPIPGGVTVKHHVTLTGSEKGWKSGYSNPAITSEKAPKPQPIDGRVLPKKLSDADYRMISEELSGNARNVAPLLPALGADMAKATEKNLKAPRPVTTISTHNVHNSNGHSNPEPEPPEYHQVFPVPTYEVKDPLPVPQYQEKPTFKEKMAALAEKAARRPVSTAA